MTSEIKTITNPNAFASTNRNKKSSAYVAKLHQKKNNTNSNEGPVVFRPVKKPTKSATAVRTYEAQKRPTQIDTRFCQATFTGAPPVKISTPKENPNVSANADNSIQNLGRNTAKNRSRRRLRNGWRMRKTVASAQKHFNLSTKSDSSAQVEAPPETC